MQARIEREARALGLSATIGSVRLTPWLSLELGDVVVENHGRVRVLSRSVVVGPRLSPLGLVGRAAHVATARVLADLPGGVRLDLAPADWVVESRWRDWRIALLSPGEALEITVARDHATLRVEARAAAARMSQRLRVLLHGCPVASLGTVDGGAQVERSATGDVRVALNARARGLALVSLDEAVAGCTGTALGHRPTRSCRPRPWPGRPRARYGPSASAWWPAGPRPLCASRCTEASSGRSSIYSSTSPGSTSRVSSRRPVSTISDYSE